MASSSSGNTGNAGKILKRANPSTIQDKFLVGYQGWFTCPGDGDPIESGHHGWLHWFNHPILDGGHPNIDLWPDVSAYSPSELFPVPGLTTKTGEPVFLFSSRNAKTVQRHFHWMAEHGVDGVFLQRFVGQCDLEAGNEGIRRIRDEVGERVREAAEREGRVFAIMYDVSGVAPDRIQKVLERDWVHLVRNQGVLDSPNYLKEGGKPVVALWGFGFDNAGHTPALVHAITQFFRNTTPGGVYIMGGSPASWRTAEGDADRNPGFLDVWMSDFDAISPWTIGRYETEQDADRFCEVKMQGDFDLIKKHNEEGRGRKVDYIPVAFPGGSGYNLSEGKWGFNNIKRQGGRFLWKQISNAKRLGVRTIYGAMWDEYDEGTAFMPVVAHKSYLPESEKFRFMALDVDGYDCPADWYMRICGFAGEGLRGERRIHETFPVKELQDYWSSRPKYEPVPQKSGDFVSGSSNITDGNGSTSESGKGSGQGDGQTYQEWLAAQKEDKEEVPPPPYSLEADELASTIAEPAVVAPTSAPAQLAAVAAAAPVAVAEEVPIVSQTPPTTTSVPQATPQVAPTTPVADSSTHPPFAGPPQQHPPVGPSYSGPAQNQQYPPDATPTTSYQNQATPQVAAATPVANASGHPPFASLPQQYPPVAYGGPAQAQQYPPAANPTLSPATYPNQSTPQVAAATPVANASGHPPFAGSPQQYPPVGPSYGRPVQAQQYPPAANPTTSSATYNPNQATPQVAPATPVANASTYPPFTGPSQQYPPAGPSYGGPTQAQQYPPAANPTANSATNYQNQPRPQDPVTSLAYDYGRQSISGPSRVEPGGGAPVGGRIPGDSTPPLHPARRPSAANVNPPYAPGPVHPGGPPRPLTSQGHSRPPSQTRPPAQPNHYNSRPQSPQGYHHQQPYQLGPPSGAATAPVSAAPERPTQGTPSQAQWPPLEWGLHTAANQGSSASTVTHSTYPGYPNQSQPPALGGSEGPAGANLSRPQTFSASSHGGANLRPNASLINRPTTTPPVSFPENPTPSSGYPGPSSYKPQGALGGGPPQPTVSSYSHTASTTEAPLHFPNPGPVHGQPAAQSTYPGQQQSSAYPSSIYGGGWPHVSPPHSPPGAASTFPGHSAYGNNSPSYGSPSQGPPPPSQYPGGPSFPTSHPSSGPGGGGGGPLSFPQGPGGDGGYFSGAPGAAPSMPSSTPPYFPSSPSSSAYPGRQSSYPGQGVGGATSYPQAAVYTPGSWMPSGPPPPSNSMPPRPQARPPTGLTFPMASTTGSSTVWSAVDRVAGRRAREQLESQVDSLTQTGNKLLNKFSK